MRSTAEAHGNVIRSAVFGHKHKLKFKPDDGAR